MEFHTTFGIEQSRITKGEKLAASGTFQGLPCVMEYYVSKQTVAVAKIASL